MAATTTTANDLLTGGLRNLNVLAAGETIAATDGSDALQVLNDLLESLSTDQLLITNSVETITAWNPGQFQYTVGNPTSSTTFGGTLTSGSNIITGVTVPGNLIVNADLSDVSTAIPAGARVSAIGTNTVTMTFQNGNVANATQNITEQVSYTVPGFFKIARPLRFRPGFTRITAAGQTGLDYWFSIINIDDYNMKGYKGVPGPWPLYLAYQTTSPLGNIFIYPNPQQAGEVHLWTDAILADLTTTTQVLNLPQGYARALKKLLAIELAPEYGKEPSMELKRQAAEAKQLIRNMNAAPVRELRFDSALSRPDQKDASWIFDGGFNR